MDFFSATSEARAGTTEDASSFADAIAARFGSSPLVLSPPLPPAFPSTPMANMSLASAAAAPAYIPVPPHALPDWLAHDDILIVDIRPHAAYASARVPRAVSLSVPSTLLKRPLFSLQQLSTMLASHHARTRFAAWSTVPRIVVYDADSSSITDPSNIHGLLRKFRSHGFDGDLAWIQGGFHALWRDRRDLIDTRPPTPDPETETEDDDQPPDQLPNGVLRTNHLPMSAFFVSSTTASNRPLSASITANRSTPLSFAGNISAPPSISIPHSRPAFNPFFDTIRQNTELSHGITERIPLRLPRRVRKRIHDLPYKWLQDLARRAANSPHSDSSESSDDDDSADPAHVDEGTEALAMQFYRIEVAEQRRLMGIMEHHSKESGRFVSEGITQASLSFPFSITAGVEKGAKNRYRHIWPFEHARVRLHYGRKPDDDDYVNASYVQPLGTSKRYIATQGPLPATFDDFWTLCWEQNIHVIIMLTREVEGSMIKCGSYWTDDTFGPLHLRLVSTSGQVSPQDEAPAPSTSTPGGFFPARPVSLTSTLANGHPAKRAHAIRRKSGTQHHGHIIKRVFELSHSGFPDAGSRRIVHLQYLEWPDMNVPDDPRGVLGLMQEAEEAVRETQGVYEDEEAEKTGHEGTKRGDIQEVDMDEMDERTGVAKHALGKRGPVLLHCSAGVGRTGGFIAVDAVLDAVRREMRKQSTQQRQDEMQVDEEPAPTMAIHLSGEGVGNQGKGNGNGKLVVHVPIVPQSQIHTPLSNEKKPAQKRKRGDGLQTPMQVDSEEGGYGWGATEPEDSSASDRVRESESEREHERESDREWNTNMEQERGSSLPPDAAATSDVTRRWAETVQDETESQRNSTSNTPSSFNINGRDRGRGRVAVPPPSSTSTGSSHPSSTTTSSIDSFEFQRYRHERGSRGTSSSMGTSVSGASIASRGSEGTRTSYIPHSRHTKSASGGLLPPFAEEDEDRPQGAGIGGGTGLGNKVGRGAGRGIGLGGVGSSFLKKVASAAADQRVRTFSAPSGWNGKGANGQRSTKSRSSPLKGESTKWLGEGGRERGAVMSPLPVGVLGTKGEGKIDEDVKMGMDKQPFKARSLSVSRKEGGGFFASMPASSAPSMPILDEAAPVHSKSTPSPLLPPHFLSLPSAATMATDASTSSRLPVTRNYTPDKLVTSSLNSKPQQQHAHDHHRAQSPVATTVDYKEPRALHGNHSPLAISGYEEPIWEVVQDMREQRMSLCQSLRQYVFVHAAVVEGALMLVDEERARQRELEKEREGEKDVLGRDVVDVGMGWGAGVGEGLGSLMGEGIVIGKAGSPYLVPKAITPSSSVASSVTFAHRSTPQVQTSSESLVSVSTTTSTNKRGASPTELVNEEKSSKRQQGIKMKASTDDEGIPPSPSPSSSGGGGGHFGLGHGHRGLGLGLGHALGLGHGHGPGPGHRRQGKNGSHSRSPTNSHSRVKAGLKAMGMPPSSSSREMPP